MRTRWAAQKTVQAPGPTDPPAHPPTWRRQWDCNHRCFSQYDMHVNLEVINTSATQRSHASSQRPRRCPPPSVAAAAGAVEPTPACSVQDRHGAAAVMCHVRCHAAQQELHQPAAHLAAYHHLPAACVEEAGSAAVSSRGRLQAHRSRTPHWQPLWPACSVSPSSVPAAAPCRQSAADQHPTSPCPPTHRCRLQVVCLAADSVSHAAHALVHLLHNDINLISHARGLRTGA